MRTLTVELDDRSYPICIGSGILSDPSSYAPHIRGKRVCIVSNETVAPLYLDTLKGALQACQQNYQVDDIILPDGEQFKTLETLNQIFTRLLEKRHNRQTTLIALGGGVIGDMTGFAAACYQRGVDFIQVPTTLLAQVDSSVGGKTAVNHPIGKNMIGAFYQPRAVIADTDTLQTLADRELRAGIAEVIKYGLITDLPFFEWLEQNSEKLLAKDAAALAEAIERSCQNKAKVVSLDEREGGVRALLNFGHTFGHAIEAAQQYKEWLHGEAVSAGMMMATDLSVRLGRIPADVIDRVKTLLQHCQLPVARPENISVERMLELMAVDKKANDSGLRLILLNAIGNAVVTDQYSIEQLTETLQQVCS